MAKKNRVRAGSRGLILLGALLLSSASASIVYAKCPGPSCPAGTPDIVTTAENAGNYQTLVAAVEAAGLSASLEGDGLVTVLAPTDEAFANLPAGTVERILSDPALLQEVLGYHIIKGAVDLAELPSNTSEIETESGTLSITNDGDLLLNGDARVGERIEASNGYLYPIDEVILPNFQ